jgi:hypothetical protein
MLRTALKSVAAQTALKSVGRVIVSENGGNEGSKAVCEEFPDLPIDYRYRKEPGTPLQHIQQLVNEELPGEFVAILHDDDWWGARHLEEGMAALSANPEASGYGCAHYVVQGESSMLNCSGNLFPWFAAQYPAFAPYWKISRLNVVLGSVLGTLAHCSGTILRIPFYLTASSVFQLGNPFDNDRMLLVAISQMGPFLFRPYAEVFVRHHGVQDCYNFSNQLRIDHMKWTTAWMVAGSGKTLPVIHDLFCKRMSLCPAEALPTLKALANYPWCQSVLAQNTERSGFYETGKAPSENQRAA